jgi:hypothetical protein
MRENQQAVNGRSLAVSPGRRWFARITRMSERQRRDRQERLATMARLGAERRRALRAGEDAPNPRHARRWS